MPRPRSSLPAITSSTCPISTPRSPGRRAARAPAMVRWRSGRCAKCEAAMREGDENARATAEAVARRSYGKLVAFLAARTRDLAGAEDALSEAFASALADWPASGIPDKPEAWLLTVAKRKSIDAARRQRLGASAGDHVRLISEELEEAAANAA